MKSKRVAVTSALLALGPAVVACEPKVEGQSHRYLAEEWCQDYAERYYLCSPSDAYDDLTPDELQERIERAADRCERSPWWDWTDRCGDLAWAYRECHASLSCEEYKLTWGPPETDPCQEPEQNYYGLGNCPSEAPVYPDEEQ